MKKILLGLITLVATIVSCTDQEDIEIAYQTNASITARHIFDTYRTVLGDQFQMKGTDFGDWDLNLHAFVYNSKGELVKKAEEKYPDLNSTMNLNLDLFPGKYSIVAIAEFTGTFTSDKYTFWNIANEDNLADLNIYENPDILNSPFETLGITSIEFEIGNRAENMSIDIQPITGLLQTIIWDRDLAGNGIDGFSSIAQYFESIEVFAPDLKQNVRFDGINPIFGYGEQVARYEIQKHSPKNQFEKRGSTEVLGFRALLPIEDRDFYWEAKVVDGKGQDLFKNGKDFQTSDMTDKINIESGKQYVMDLLLDGLYLFVDEYNPNETMFERIERYISSLNEKAFNQIMDRNFDTFIGVSESSVKATFGNNGLLINGTIYYFGYNQYVSTLAFGFTEDTNQVKTISLIFQNLNDDFRERMTKYLTNRFTVYEKGTDAHQKAFINGSDLADSNIGITWNIDKDILTYVKLK